MKTNLFGKKSKWLLILPLSIILSLGFVKLQDQEFEIIKNLEIFYSLFSELNRYYVDDTNSKELVESAINGMLSSLDPYTSYIPEEELEEFNFMTTGEYGGIGAYIRKAGEYAIISEPYEGFPAQKSGLMAGDTIITINGISAKGKDISEVSDMLKGTPNTNLNIEIKRTGVQEIIEKTLERQQIVVPNVPYFGMLDDNIGYIRLSNFTRDAGEESSNALKELKKMGASSIVFDLRSNPGGLLIESVNVANIFVKRGQEIVSTKGKVSQWDNVYRTNLSPVDTTIPLVVLVDRSSASASEIVAGALQDLDRAVILGQRTFGKGLVQTTRPLSYNSQLKVTTAKYYIPSGRCIQAVDYSHRNEDGSVGFVPDSLIQEFETLNGRKVFDGGGIAPDIATEPEQFSSIAVSLYTKNLIFDYATLYVADNTNPPSVSNFRLSDLDYSRFVEFLRDKDYDYTTASDDQLQTLVETARRERYYELAEKEFEALKIKLNHDKEKDLNTFSDEIKMLLEEEIASRYYYQKGRIQSTLKDDKEVMKAVELLKDPQQYAAILKGTKISSEATVAAIK